MDKRSESSLVGVHPDLVAVCRAVDAVWPGGFLVIHGLRTHAEEAALVASGASTTMHSRHLPNTHGFACAIDFAALENGHVTWDAKAYTPIALHFKAEGLKLKTPVEWGGDWKTFKDLGHVQLPWATYP
jgi:peptidoglycan L-alanyl-D-glutamate endopeptidase CwlK